VHQPDRRGRRLLDDRRLRRLRNLRRNDVRRDAGTWRQLRFDSAGPVLTQPELRHDDDALLFTAAVGVVPVTRRRHPRVCSDRVDHAQLGVACCAPLPLRLLAGDSLTTARIDRDARKVVRAGVGNTAPIAWLP